MFDDFKIDLGFGEKKPKRDKRRAFTPTMKNEIRHKQNNKCARCKKTLDPRDIHYHQKKPWADGGPTTVTNGKAVCGSCHNILGHKIKMKKENKKKKSKKGPFGLDVDFGKGLF